jgi:hypothetical protein
VVNLPMTGEVNCSDTALSIRRRAYSLSHKGNIRGLSIVEVG